MQEHVLQPGTLLDARYRIDAVLGEGGFGITYAAENVRIGLRVAVKELFWRGHSDRDAAASPEVVLEARDRAVFAEQKERFLREARTIRDFSGLPGVVRILDYFEANATAYIVMEYVEGETLAAQLARRGRIPAEELFRSFLPLIESLEKIHAGGVIHRDISPNNIMVQPDGSLKLIDFGAARAYRGAEDAQYTAITKDSYAPSEQYDRNGKQGPWTDVYALCATLYTCATGVAPLSAVQRLFLDELKSPSQLGVEIAAPYEAVILRGLKMAATQRFQDMGALAQAVRAALPAPKPAGSRRRSVALGALAGLACVAVALGLWLYHEYDAAHKFRGVETEAFCLYAPADMTAAGFAQMQQDLDAALADFAGADNYLAEVAGDAVRVELPLECFGGREIYSVLRETFLPLVDGKSYNLDYELKANWEDPAASLTAGENQVLPAALEGEMAEFSCGWTKGLTPGQRANQIMDLKVRLDALGTPYAFGTLYGDEDSVVVRIAPDRLNAFVLDSLVGTYGALQVAGEYTDFALSFSWDGYAGSGVEIVERADGSFCIRCDASRSSVNALRLENLLQSMRASGQEKLYLQSGGGYALAELPLEEVPEDVVLEFQTFRFEEFSTLGAQQRWIADYVDALVNQTGLPAPSEIGAVGVLDASGETDFGASLADKYGLTLAPKEGDAQFYARLGQIVEERGYAVRTGDAAVRLYLNLDVDEYLMEKLDAAMTELLVGYGLKDMVINPSFSIQVYDAQEGEQCLILLDSSWDADANRCVNAMGYTFTAEGRFAPYAEAFRAWWAGLPWEELGLQRGIEWWR